jgi:hypothetical protein
MILVALSALVSLQAPETGTLILSRRYQTQSRSSDGSTSSSNGRDELSEEIVAYTPEGTEVRFDLPKGSTAEERKREWLFPARIFYPSSGPPRRLDRAEAEGRLAEWLKGAGLERKACGTWYLTWNAFMVECDPDAFIALVGEFSLRSVPAREGALLGDPMAGTPVALRKEGRALAARYTLDPDKYRMAIAESDVIAGKITGRPVTLNRALLKRVKQGVTGTIGVRLDLSLDETAVRRTRVATIETKDESGTTTTETREEVTESTRAR